MTGHVPLMYSAEYKRHQSPLSLSSWVHGPVVRRIHSHPDHRRLPVTSQIIHPLRYSIYKHADYDCAMDQELTSQALSGLPGSRRTLLHMQKCEIYSSHVATLCHYDQVGMTIHGYFSQGCTIDYLSNS